MKTTFRVLIVDDSPTNRCILVKSLKSDDCELIEAADGLQAIELTNKQAPDMILLDVMMPGMDGFEVCRILKTQESTSSIPIVFLTARIESHDIERGFSLGGCDYITKPFRISEVKARVSVHLQLRQAQLELIARNQKLERMSRIIAETNMELARQSRLDSLTKLLNRSAWGESIMLEHDRSSRYISPYSVLMLDIDHFKAFNDTQGHQAGDECLRGVAQCVQSTCRRTDVIGRYGGEEFIILAPETSEQQAIALGEKILQAVSNLAIPHPSSACGDRVTVSVGIAQSTTDDWQKTVKLADDALYAAKAAGRNQLRVAASPEPGRAVRAAATT